MRGIWVKLLIGVAVAAVGAAFALVGTLLTPFAKALAESDSVKSYIERKVERIIAPVDARVAALEGNWTTIHTTNTQGFDVLISTRTVAGTVYVSGQATHADATKISGNQQKPLRLTITLEDRLGVDLDRLGSEPTPPVVVIAMTHDAALQALGFASFPATDGKESVTLISVDPLAALVAAAKPDQPRLRFHFFASFPARTSTAR